MYKLQQSRTPQRSPQKQLTWTQECTESEVTTCMGLAKVLYIYVIVVQLGTLVGLPTVGAGVVPKILTGFWEPIPHNELLSLP